MIIILFLSPKDVKIIIPFYLPNGHTELLCFTSSALRTGVCASVLAPTRLLSNQRVWGLTKTLANSYSANMNLHDDAIYQLVNQYSFYSANY